jgi:hypothetical protein
VNPVGTPSPGVVGANSPHLSNEIVTLVAGKIYSCSNIVALFMRSDGTVCKIARVITGVVVVGRTQLHTLNEQEKLANGNLHLSKISQEYGEGNLL